MFPKPHHPRYNVNTMKIKNFFKLVAAVLVCQLAGGIGALFTSSAIPVWYESLVRPALNPPNWIFGPVWTTLYLLMGISLFLIWQKGFKHKEVKIAVGVFAVQLVLNSIWSIIFFGMQNPGLALVEIVVLWFAILASIILFYKISKPASYLLVPYILWVSFATYLNYAIWMLN